MGYGSKYMVRLTAYFLWLLLGLLFMVACIAERSVTGFVIGLAGMLYLHFWFMFIP